MTESTLSDLQQQRTSETHIEIHPNFGDRVVRVDGQPYHWNGNIARYRRGYGPYATYAMIGAWRTASAAEAKEIRSELR